MRVPWSFCISDLSALSHQQFFKYSSCFPALHCFPTRVPALLSCDSFDLRVTLSNLQGRSSFCDTTFLTQCQNLFWGAPKSLQMVTAAMKLKDACSLEVMTNPDSILKSRGITLPTKVHLVKAMVFPVVMHT